jgi:hypothetical protein
MHGNSREVLDREAEAMTQRGQYSRSRVQLL